MSLINRSYRTLVRKEVPGESAINPSLSSSSSPSSAIKHDNTDENKSNGLVISSTATRLRRRSSTHGTSGSSTQASSSKDSQLALLNSIRIDFPIHDIPRDLLRFIPDLQLKTVEPFISKPLAEQSFIVKQKYSTNVDERGYLTVFEYQINENWIIWDYSTGYVFFTGLWKSCGNNKTDIVKLIENFPNISNTVKRVRGGFLKIQGTWLPFDIVRNLAKNFCFNIRYCLIPLFGTSFPDECLKPNDKNYGKLVDVNAPVQPSRRRRSTLTSSSTLTNSNNINSIQKAKVFKKVRSKSDSNYQSNSQKKVQPILEMEEILKASKRLHDLSSNFHETSHYSFQKRRSSFNYGGFIWAWNSDGENLKILGRDDDDAIIDEDLVTPTLPSSTKLLTKSQLSIPRVQFNPIAAADSNFQTTPQYKSNTDYDHSSIPKQYDGFDTLLNAAYQLMNFKKDDEPIKSPSSREKMDIIGLLS